MKVELNNGQSGGPYLRLVEENKSTGEETEKLRVYFLEDGGIVQFEENGEHKSIGTRKGPRPKEEQTDFVEAEPYDGIELGNI